VLVGEDACACGDAVLMEDIMPELDAESFVVSEFVPDMLLDVDIEEVERGLEVSRTLKSSEINDLEII